MKQAAARPEVEEAQDEEEEALIGVVEAQEHESHNSIDTGRLFFVLAGTAALISVSLFLRRLYKSDHALVRGSPLLVWVVHHSALNKSPCL